MWWLVTCVNTHLHIKWNHLDNNNHIIMRIGTKVLTLLSSIAVKVVTIIIMAWKLHAFFHIISHVWKVIPSNKTLMHSETCVGRASFTFENKTYDNTHDNTTILFSNLLITWVINVCGNERLMYVCMCLCMCMCNHKKTSNH